MSDKSPIWLHSVGVVIIAQYHNPSILNRDFLAKEGIVPEAWDVADTIIVPTTSMIQYTNGVRWLVDQKRLEVTCKCNMPIQEYTDRQVQDLAVSYVKKLPYVPYRALGLNCTVSVIREDPEIWLTRKFLKTYTPDKKLRMVPTFNIDLGDMVLNLAFGIQLMVRDNNQPTDSIVVNCNIHYGGQFTSASLCDKICQWPEHKKNIIHELNDLLEAA